MMMMMMMMMIISDNDDVMRVNELMLEETRDTITVMLRMLALNHIRSGAGMMMMMMMIGRRG